MDMPMTVPKELVPATCLLSSNCGVVAFDAVGASMSLGSPDISGVVSCASAHQAVPGVRPERMASCLCCGRLVCWTAEPLRV